MGVVLSVVIDPGEQLRLCLETRFFAELPQCRVHDRLAGLARSARQLPIQRPVRVMDEQDVSLAVEDRRRCTHPPTRPPHTRNGTDRLLSSAPLAPGRDPLCGSEWRRRQGRRQGRRQCRGWWGCEADGAGAGPWSLGGLCGG